jgi:hypothetical protein
MVRAVEIEPTLLSEPDFETDILDSTPIHFHDLGSLIRQTDRRNGSDSDLKCYFPGPILGLSCSRCYDL